MGSLVRARPFGPRALEHACAVKTSVRTRTLPPHSLARQRNAKKLQNAKSPPPRGGLSLCPRRPARLLASLLPHVTRCRQSPSPLRRSPGSPRLRCRHPLAARSRHAASAARPSWVARRQLPRPQGRHRFLPRLRGRHLIEAGARPRLQGRHPPSRPTGRHPTRAMRVLRHRFFRGFLRDRPLLRCRLGHALAPTTWCGFRTDLPPTHNSRTFGFDVISGATQMRLGRKVDPSSGASHHVQCSGHLTTGKVWAARTTGEVCAAPLPGWASQRLLTTGKVWAVAVPPIDSMCASEGFTRQGEAMLRVTSGSPRHCAPSEDHRRGVSRHWIHSACTSFLDWIGFSTSPLARRQSIFAVLPTSLWDVWRCRRAVM